MKLQNIAKILLFVTAIALIAGEAVSQALYPSGYESLTEAAATAQDLHLQNDELMDSAVQSGLAAASECLPCKQAAEAATCPDNCECWTDAAAAEWGLTLCNDELIECLVYVSPAVGPLSGHCYQAAEEPAEAVTCPDNCECLTDAAAEEQGLTLCDGEPIECIVSWSLVAAPVLGHCYQTAEEPSVCQDADINLRRVHLQSGEIKFIADISCPVAKVDMIIGGVTVKQCAGDYCEYTGGPYGAQDIPTFSAIPYDDLNNPLTTATYVPYEITVSLPDVGIVELPEPEDLCPFCPEPEPEWGELVSCTCEGNDHFQAYDWTSQVQLTGCYYGNHTMTVGYIGGMLAQIIAPISNYCINEDDIVLHKCQNGVYIAEYTYTCPYGCDGGQCRCETSDHGKNYFERGGVLCGDGTVLVPGTLDECLDDYTLREYYTVLDLENNTCTIKYEDYECPGYCADGECHGTCYDGIRNEDETGVDCGGSCLVACPDDINWYAQNYGFGFMNPSGEQLNHGDCWSYDGDCSDGYGNYKDTFGACSVCWCHPDHGYCGGHKRLDWFTFYEYCGASAGHCLGMCLMSLEMYNGDVGPQEYFPTFPVIADLYEVVDLYYMGMVERHIDSEQGKTVSWDTISHYLYYDSYWGANDVLKKVEESLDNDPPEYGMIIMIEDDGFENGIWQSPLGHVVIATDVEYVSSDLVRIYVYDPNQPVEKAPMSNSPYFDITKSPYIEIDKASNHYTFYQPNKPWEDPETGLWYGPLVDTDGDLFSNEDDQLYDRIGFMPYEKLRDVRLPDPEDVLAAIIVETVELFKGLGAVDVQVEDSEGRILGFTEEGSNAPIIENATVLPIFGEPDSVAPRAFVLPMADYKVNILGIGSGNYSASILGGSQAFAIRDAEVSEGTKDTISLQYGAEGKALLSFSTSDAEKQYSLLITSQGEDNGAEPQTLYGVTDSTISSDSKALFSVDPHSQSLLYTNYGDKAVTYSLQIYRTPIMVEGMEMANPMGGDDVNTALGGAGTYADALTTTSSEADDLGDLIDNIPITEVYTFTIEPMETHILSPEDWSNLPASEIVVEVEKCGDGVCGAHENYLTCPEDCKAPLDWPLIVGIIGGLVVIGIVVLLLARRRGGSPQAGQ